MAAASVAQVHLGRLADGIEVAVKVQRPGLRRRFEADIRRPVEHRSRQPKELVLFSKNLLYLNGLCNAFAPDINLLAQIAPIFLYFQAKYPNEIAAILMGSLGAHGQVD